MVNVNRILIVGGTGTNGRELIRQLRIKNIPVRVLVRNKRKASAIFGEGVELVEGDLSKIDTLNSALKEIKTAYIVTAIHPDSVLYYSNFFDAAKNNNIENIIKISSLGASVNSSSEILRQHGESDQTLINFGLNYVILRPNSFYQNLFWQAKQIKRRNRFSLPLADAKQSLVDVRDIAEATVNLCEKYPFESGIYNLTGPEPLSFNDVASQLGDVRGKPVEYVAVSSDASEQGMKSVGVPEWNARALSELQKKFAIGEFSEVSSDLKKLLGREPRNFKKFVNDHVDMF